VITLFTTRIGLFIGFYCCFYGKWVDEGSCDHRDLYGLSLLLAAITLTSVLLAIYGRGGWPAP